ncbi:Solute carrier family 25 member 36 [Geodia barretti]|nr:Solute carrier family 25 member 36 [Geodia barretti]
MEGHMTTVLVPRGLAYARHLFQTEGGLAFFKGLAPSLFGIIPTRALYFTAYSQAKQFYNSVFRYESAAVHLASAVTAGITTTTATSPIWVVKTQIQLDTRPGKSLGPRRCIKRIYNLDGLRGFYRGLTASYAGTLETAIHFVIYEHMKKVLSSNRQRDLELTECMFAAAAAKMTASSLCYPHEVCRTRLRQNVTRSERRYHNFLQTLRVVWFEEGVNGLYGGMGAHLIRVVPNTAIVFFTYEAVVRILGSGRDC